MMPQTIHDPWADPWADVDESAFEDAIVGATDLLQAVAGRDFPEGVVVIGRRLAPGIQGLSVGTGHRIAAAKTRLADPGEARVSISTIAYDIGFASLGPFNRAFKEEAGVSPSEWRRKMLEDPSPIPVSA